MPPQNEFIPYTPIKGGNIGGPPSNDEFIPYSPAPKRPEATWGDTLITGGLRTIPALAGGIVGTVFGGPLGGVGAGMGLSGLGETAAQWYEREYGLRDEFNPLQIGVQTGLGGIGGFVKAPAQLGAKALAKYAGLNALEGGILNAAAEVPTQLAETGELPSWGQIGTSGAVGVGFGGALGAGAGKYLQGKLPVPEITPPHVDVAAPPPPPASTPFAPIGAGPDAGIGGPIRQPQVPADKITRREWTPDMVDYFHARGYEQGVNPEGYEFMARPGVTPPPQDPMDALRASIGGEITPQQLPETFTITAATTGADLELKRNQGYVSVPDLRDSQGRVMMVRGDIAPMYVNRPAAVPAAPQERVNRPEFASAIQEGEIGIREGQDIEIPTQSATPRVIEGLKKERYVLRENTRIGTSIFRRLLEGEEGTFDPQEMWNNLRRLMGRDPTPDEVNVAMQRQPQEGETTGRVAAFPARATNFFEVVTGIKEASKTRNVQELESLMARADQLIDETMGVGDINTLASRDDLDRKISNARTNYSEITARISRAETPDEAELLQQIADNIKERANELVALQRGDNERFGFGQIRPMKDLRNQMMDQSGAPMYPPEPPPPQLGPRGIIQGGAIGEPSGDINALRNQSQLQRVSQPNPMEGGMDLGPSPTMEQFGPLRAPEVPEMQAPEVPAPEVGVSEELPVTPEGQIDTSTTPDVGERRGIVTQIKDLTKKFLDDDSGEFTPGAMLDHIRQMVARRRAKTRPDIIESEVLGSHEDAIVQQQSHDLHEIESNTDRGRAREIAIFWREEHRREFTARRETTEESEFTDPERHAANMLTEANRRVRELGGQEPSYAENVSGPERTRRADLSEITDTDDMIELDNIEEFWRAQLTRSSGREGGMEQRHAARMLEAVEARIQEVTTNQPAMSERSPELQEMINRMNERDRVRIAEATDTETLRGLIEDWEEMGRNRLSFNEADRAHNVEMLELARERLLEMPLEDWEVYPETTTTPGANPAVRDELEIANTTDAGIAQGIRNRWQRTLTQAIANRNNAVANHAREMARVAEDRMRVLREGSGQSATTETRATTDVREITDSSDIAEIQAIGERWDQAYEYAIASNDAMEAAHARYMRGIAETRVRELRNPDTATNLRTIDATTRENNISEIQNANTEEQLIRLIHQWETDIQRHSQSYDVSSRAHADAMLRMAGERYTAATGQPVPTRPVNVQNEPVVTGPRQVSKEKVKISKEKYNKIANQVGASRRAQIERTVQTPRHNRPNHWDNWAKEQLDKIGDGPPGLSVEKNTVRYYNNSWNVVYRDAAGKPLALAIVDEHSNGRRTTDTLASDRFRGFASGRAVNAVIKTVFEMNGGEFTGSISDYTGNLIMRLVDAVSEEAGSYTLGGIVKSLMRVKQDLLRGKPLLSRKFNTPDEMLDAMEKMSGDKSLGWRARNAPLEADDLVSHIPTPNGDEAIQIPNGPVVSKNIFQRLLTEDQGATPISDITGMGKRLKQATGWGQGGVVPPKPRPKKGGGKKQPEPNYVVEAMNVPTNLTTTMDLSAPGRQGLSQIFTPEFWKAIVPSLKAGASAQAKANIDAELMNKPLFQRKLDLRTGRLKPSVADEAGMKVVGGGDTITGQEGSVATRWVEALPIIGMPIRASNRAYATFLNHLRANRFEKLMNTARDMSIKGVDTKKVRPGFFSQNVTEAEALELNPFQNKQLAKEIADFVNTATGRGPLKMHILPHRKTEVSLEGAAKYLSAIMFSPRLIASRMRMLNPSTYIMATPYVRKQYMKSMLAAGSAWAAMTELAKYASDEVEVSHDPLSADFGKIKIGETRLDPGASFQQFMVAYSRFWMGEYSSSSTGERHRYGSGFQAQTQFDAGERLFSNKLNPVTKFAYDLLNATEYQPFHVADRSAQMFIPLVVQDIWELGHDNPDLIPPFLLPIIFGMGTQTYSKGESVGKFIDPENDILVTGGGPAEWMPWRQE